MYVQSVLIVIGAITSSVHDAVLKLNSPALRASDTTEKASCWVIIKITQWYQANELLWFDLFHFRCSYCISLPSGHAYQVNLHTAATHTYTSLKENRFPYNNKANACWAELASCNFSWLSHSPTLSKTTEEATIAERHANTNSTG